MSILPGRRARQNRRLVSVSFDEREPSAAELVELEAEVPLLLAEAELILLDAGVPAAVALTRYDEVADRRGRRIRSRVLAEAGRLAAARAGFPLEVA